MKKGEVIMAVSGNPGLMTILAVDACIHDGFVGFRNLREDILPQYLYFILNTLKDENNQKADGAVFRNLTTDQIKDFEIPLPPLEIQQQKVAEIEGYQKEIEELKAQIKQKEQKIKTKIGEVWGVKEEEEPELLIAAEPEVEYLKSGV
jgi:hypothetical protein